MAEVIWTGSRMVDCRRHPNPTRVWPIRASINAFGGRMPAADVLLSPDHAVFVDRVLIPIRLLVNGRTVRQVPMDRVTYHHVELSRHDVMLANGMPAESYLECGDRLRFSQCGEVIALHPDFSARDNAAGGLAARVWKMHGCAPLMLTGPIVDGVRRRLAAESGRRKTRPHDTFSPGSTWPA